MRDSTFTGAVNVVTTSREHAPEVGRVLCASPIVHKLSFTGSTATGKLLMAQCADTVKRLSLELGGACLPVVVACSGEGIACYGS